MQTIFQCLTKVLATLTLASDVFLTSSDLPPRRSRLSWLYHFWLCTLVSEVLSRSDKSSRGGSGHKSDHKTTRVRTVLNEKQLHTLRTCYNANPRPDALMKEQLTEMTGLSPRVIRVWFQNKRCKDKKRSILMKQMQQQQEKRLNATGQAGSDGSPSALLAASDLHTSGCLLHPRCQRRIKDAFLKFASPGCPQRYLTKVSQCGFYFRKNPGVVNVESEIQTPGPRCAAP
ncbi:hypothetical protein RRG08_043541 [Elysia crispata]|uniref:Homeobox domain-containing protein n=1 Tax=Elysia crispata TaxID=231223 RepID=A0AAE0YFP3_9GAST|nr:hypothetical protein RRG08_043541 [Elysia crispata]